MAAVAIARPFVEFSIEGDSNEVGGEGTPLAALNEQLVNRKRH